MSEEAKNRGGRPPGPGKPMGERIAAATDRKLIEWLTKGVEHFSGQLDANSQPIMVVKSLSANHMAQVLKRLKQIDAGVFGSGRMAMSLVEAARARGIGAGAAKFGTSNQNGA